MQRDALRLAASAAVALLAAAGLVARADDGKPAEKPAAPAAASSEAEALAKYKGPEIEWARSWRDAQEEAAERNVAIFVHSHGST